MHGLQTGVQETSSRFSRFVKCLMHLFCNLLQFVFLQETIECMCFVMYATSQGCRVATTTLNPKPYPLPAVAHQKPTDWQEKQTSNTRKGIQTIIDPRRKSFRRFGNVRFDTNSRDPALTHATAESPKQEHHKTAHVCGEKRQKPQYVDKARRQSTFTHLTRRELLFDRPSDDGIASATL